MKEKFLKDLGLDNGDDLLEKFNLEDLVDIEKYDNSTSEEKATKQKIKEIKKNV